MEHPWDGGTKVCSNGLGHITNMAAMPIYGKNLKNLLWKQKTRKLVMQHQILEYYQVCSIDDPRLTLTFYLRQSKNMFPYLFVWEHNLTVDFLETIEVYDLKVGI